jgi:3-isopropylmalate/(R)-2-methylmalate dehydratase small subunit
VYPLGYIEDVDEPRTPLGTIFSTPQRGSVTPFTTLTGIVAPLDRVNVDTDQIIPKQFLKTIKRTGLREGLFFDWRKRKDGSPDPGFFLNQARYRDATILLARDNFGSGSSREHAPWALLDQGFRCVIAPSFADIFYNNCFQNGILAVVLKADEVQALFQSVAVTEGYRLAVDLAAQTVTTPEGTPHRFEIDPFRKDCLLKGLDSIGLTLQQEPAITAYERHRAAEAPWLFADPR